MYDYFKSYRLFQNYTDENRGGREYAVRSTIQIYYRELLEILRIF